MSEPVLEVPHYLDPDEPRIGWRRLGRQVGLWALWVTLMLVAFRVLDQTFDDEEPMLLIHEVVYGTSVQCLRISAEVSPGGQQRHASEEGAVALGACDELGLASSPDPVTHPNGKRYIDTYRTEYHVRVAQFELEEGRSEYGPEEATELLRIVDEACYQHYAGLSPYSGTWNGCPGDPD
jgi:hypothetical protein